MSNAKQYGFQSAIIAGLGRIMAFVVMIFLAASGLAAILYASQTLFLVIKVIGALYLFSIAYQLWCSDGSAESSQIATNKSLVLLVKQEFLLAAGNPKAILVFTAFLPQFIDPQQQTGVQFMMLGLVFLCLELVAIALYACFGLYLRNWFSKPGMRRLFNRCCASFLACAGIGLLVQGRE